MLKILGQGGCGRTFLAVAKAPPGQPTGQSAPSLYVVKQSLRQVKSINRFYADARHLKQLGTHPQIPRFWEAFEQDGQGYLVQSYIEGQTLEQTLNEQGPFNEAQIWQVLNDLLPVLQFMHDRNVIHRDIKPTNLICPASSTGQNARLVLVDFGAAKWVHSTRSLYQEVVGSPEYVAPEQARGKAVFASDLYSLGLTCLHLLTGLSPFDLFDPVNNTWAWQEALAQPASETLATLLNGLLQDALDQRFQSAAEVMQAMPNSARGVTTLGTMPNPIYTAADWECRAVLTGHKGSVNAVAISSTNRWLASGGDDKTIRLWELTIGKPIATLTGHSHSVKSLAFFTNTAKADHDFLVSASQDKTLRLWNASTHQCVQTFTGHTQIVTAVVPAYFEPEGLLVSASWDKTVRLWHRQTGQMLSILAQHRLAITAIATNFATTPDQSLGWIASASCDRTVHLHTLHSGMTGYSAQRQHILSDHTGAVLAVAFSPGGRVVATGGDDRTIKLWEVATGELLQTLSGHSWAVAALSFTAEGQILVSGSWDGTVKLWAITELGADPVPLTLTGHTDSVNAIAISPDGQTIVSASRDETLRIWQRQL